MMSVITLGTMFCLIRLSAFSNRGGRRVAAVVEMSRSDYLLMYLGPETVIRQQSIMEIVLKFN